MSLAYDGTAPATRYADRHVAPLNELLNRAACNYCGAYLAWEATFAEDGDYYATCCELIYWLVPSTFQFRVEPFRVSLKEGS